MSVHPLPLYTPCLYVPIPPVHLYVLHIPYVCHMSWELGRHPYTTCLGSLLGASGHLSGISMSVSTSICLLLHNSHTSCSPLLWVASYWTGCIWMSAMLHAVVPFFVVFIMSQASTTKAIATTTQLTCVFWYIISSLSHYYGPLLDGTSSNIRLQHNVVLPSPLIPGHSGGVVGLAIMLAAATSISDASSALCQLCHGSSTGRFLFQS